MFLNKLSSKEKELFLDMTFYVTKSNGLVDEVEQHLITQYCNEMNIDSNRDRELHSLDEIYSVFSNSSDASKRIAVFELLGLSYSDGSFDEQENSLIVDFSKAIGVTDNVIKILNHDIEEYRALFNIIHDHVFSNY